MDKKITGLPTITVGSVGLESDFIGFYQGEDEVKSAPIDDLVKRMDDKEFDMVAVGRALLSDPEWVNKVKEGRYDEVIPFSKKHAENYYLFSSLGAYLHLISKSHQIQSPILS